MFLLPHVGNSYQEGINNETIMIFGESHYDEEPFDNSQKTTDYTPKVVEDIVTKRKKVRFFKYVGQLFSDDWTEVWSKVAFANLIQHVFEKGEQPKTEHIQTVKSFYQYIEQLKPDKAIICSKRAWNEWFAKHNDNEDGVEVLNNKLGISSVFKFPHSTGHTLVIGINHTSWQQETDYVERWKPVVANFLNYRTANKEHSS